MNFVIVQAVNTSIVTKLIMLINTTKACISVHNNFHTTWATKTISFSLTTQCDTIQICVCNCVVLYGKQPNNQFYLEIDRYISQYLGFIDISVSAKTADIIGLNRSWQNAVVFLMHPDTLHKKAQRSKSKQLSYNNASRCGFINKQTRWRMRWPSQPKQKRHREVSQCLKPPRAGRCCVRMNSHYTSGSFSSTKNLTGTLRCRSPIDA